MPDRQLPGTLPIRTNPVHIRRASNVLPWWRQRVPMLLLDLLVGIALFAMSFSINLGHIETTGFHPDETRWLNRAYYIEDLTDPYGSTWQDYYLTRGQPPLGSYVIGLGQWVQGKSMHPNLVWDFYYGGSSNWNTIAGAMPSHEDLMAGRRTSAFVGGLAVMVAYFISRKLTNIGGGIVTALCIAFHRLNWGIGSQALSDQTLLLTLGLIVLVGFQFMKRPNWPWAITLGVMFGLGGAAKLSPLLLSGVATGMGCILLFRWLLVPVPLSQRLKDRSTGIKLVVQPFIAFATFVLVYPYLWVEPLRRSWYLYDFRIREMASQGATFEGTKVNGIVDTFSRITSQIGTSRQISYQLMEWMNEHLGTNFSMIKGLDLAIGSVAILFVVMLALKSGLRSPHFFTIVLLGAEAGIIIYGLRSDFYRYYLPLVLIMFICVGVMVGMILEWLVSKSSWAPPKRPIDITRQSGLFIRVARRHRPARIRRHARSGKSRQPTLV